MTTNELNIGDKVGYRLHNSMTVIKDTPDYVVDKTEDTVTLKSGIKLKLRKGDWIWPLKDNHGSYYTTFYRID